jgi:glycogen debranching enzyme
MVPAFWPPITEDDTEWNQLNANYSYSFKNKPYHYHNGGVWPMVNSFWGMALLKAGKTNTAKKLLSSITEFVKKGKENNDWGFYEYADSLNGTPGGTDRMAWSAAGLILLKKTLEGKQLF